MARTGIASFLSCCRKYVRFKQPFRISGIIWEKIRPQSCNRSEWAQDRGCRTAVIPADRHCTGFNCFGAKTHNSGKLDAIRAVEGVKRVFVERTYEPQRAEKEEMLPQMITSSAMIGSNLVWANGYPGAGSRIAVIDTGTDTDHQAFDNDAFLYALEQNAMAANMTKEAYASAHNILADEVIAVPCVRRDGSGQRYGHSLYRCRQGEQLCSRGHELGL